MAIEEGWGRHAEFVQLSLAEASALVGEPLRAIAPLTGGRRNTNYRVVGEREPRTAVLRLHTADPAACLREQRLLEMVRGTVPVPRVLRFHADADLPWSLLEFVEGERFDHALIGASGEAVRSMTRSAGAALAAIHRFKYPCAGFFDAQLRVTDALDASFAWHALVESMLALPRVRDALGEEQAARLGRLVVKNTRLEEAMSAGGPCLSHSDYKPWNLIARNGEVAAVLDWEFAFVAAPLNDIGNFVRYSARQAPEYEAGFVEGYVGAGGELPSDWKRLARLVDLINLCDFLSRPDETGAIRGAVVPLVAATLREFG